MNMGTGDIINMGAAGGINVSDAQGMNKGLNIINGTGVGAQATAEVTKPQSDGLSKIREFFPDFRIYTAEELKAAGTQGLSEIFNKLNNTLDKANALRVQVQTQIEGKEEERKKIILEVKERFGVETVEELQTIMETELNSFAELMRKLETVIK